MTIFISVPMHNKTPEEIDQAINDCVDWWESTHHPADAYITNADKEEAEAWAENLLKEKDIEEFEPTIHDNKRARRFGCLASAIFKMAFADAVIFAPGWEEDDNCLIEHTVATRYGIPCYYKRYKGLYLSNREAHLDGLLPAS